MHGNGDEADLASDILHLQQELFVAGAELATAPEASDRLEDGVSRVTEGMVDALEVDIDRYMRQVDLPPQFVIPGGTELSAALDVARAMLRRAERRVVQLRDDRGPRLRGRARATSTAPPTCSSRWPASPTRRTRSSSRAGARTGRRAPMARSAVARRREGFETEVEIREHRLIVDETVDDGGKDQGPRPTELLAASLASCTTITLVMYADRKGWDVGAVEAAVDYSAGDVRLAAEVSTSRSRSPPS